MNNYIHLVPDETLLSSGISKYIQWNYTQLPHVVIFGSTGSGKTYFLKILLGRIALHISKSELIICDFKSDDDFSFLETASNFYRFDDCIKGLDQAVSILHERQHNLSSDRHFLCLVFDEWASFLNNLDKKDAEIAKKKLATLLMLGRSFNIHVIVSQQRLDATYFGQSRDNFSVICGLGALSKESVDMMFSEYKDMIQRSKEQGHGTMILGNQFYNIVVPHVTNIQKLHSAIRTAVNRSTQNDHATERGEA